MQVVSSPTQVQRLVQDARAGGHVVGLVPTMGALHSGHLSLVERAAATADFVVVSIFVNPTQFGPAEDLARYPADLQGDLSKIEGLGVDLVFAPSVGDMYPEGPTTWVEVEGADRHLCGPFRPGHFRGVTTIVAKLFNICLADKAFFGLKDAQQFLIIRRMIDELNFSIEPIGCPTVREPDGLAMSSRNVYLNDRERKQAVVLSQAVAAAGKLITDGERDPEIIQRAMRAIVASAPDAVLQYAEVVDTRTIAPVDRLSAGREVVAALAVFFGGTRLIDNVFVTVPPS
ncbi:MAG TPA: pantoate--beta-alanine ligase [Rhodothermia bacterium]